MISACGASSEGDASKATETSQSIENTDVQVTPQSNEDAPVIGRILTDIRNLSASYGGTISDDTETIKFAVNVEVSDPQGIEDIDFVYFYKNDGEEWYWLLYDAYSYEEFRNECRLENSNVFECVFYDSSNPYKIDLQGWELAVVDKAGNISLQEFQFTHPEGLTPSYENFVYSDYYTGSIEFGVPALQSLSEYDDDVFIFTREGTQSFEFRFNVSDSRVKEYAIEIWGFDGIWNYIGYVLRNSPSITSTPITHGVETRVNIPWSEINLFDGYTSSDIGGFHILLHDELTEVQDGYGWSNHMGVSDFIMPDIRVDRDLYPDIVWGDPSS